MKSSLEQMWWDYNLITDFKKEMLRCGNIYKDVLFLEGILYGLNKNIDNESLNVLNDLLRKTYFRLLIKINKGREHLIDIVNNSSHWNLAPIESYPEAWIQDDVLIFTTEKKCAVFCKKEVENNYKYTDNKWQ
jgi:hypothetical protein